ncbi:MAG: hypothetical protein CM1200mP29_07270 [Verrucomicrobiota bacterium]|nr:MAG: hypothetical protein CM1200mP29_07270 [Verrucomicrobiota bacterium]
MYAGTAERRFTLIPMTSTALLGVQGGTQSALWRAPATQY